MSRANQGLDTILAAWRQRALGEIICLFLDAHYKQVRQEDQIRDAAILIATGVELQGKRQILGVSSSLGEQEVH